MPSAILILPLTFAPLSIYRDTSRVSLLFDRRAENSNSPAKYGHTTCICYSKKRSSLSLNCVAGTIFLSTIIQAGSQSIENVLHEGEAREWCFHWSGLVRTLVGFSHGINKVKWSNVGLAAMLAAESFSQNRRCQKMFIRLCYIKLTKIYTERLSQSYAG